MNFTLADGLIQYLMLVALLTFHEFGHAWVALKCEIITVWAGFR